MPDDATLRLDLLLWGLAAFTAVWVAAVGASIGSFLNVVVYRMPAGLSLISPASYCPRCRTPISRGDNIPLFGWLRLRGKCRACGLPISARYPLVEAATAALFLYVAHLTLLTRGGMTGATDAPGLRYLLWHVRAEQLVLALYQLCLLCHLLCFALIAWDGQRLPKVLECVSVIVGYAVVIVEPAVQTSISPVVGWLAQTAMDDTSHATLSIAQACCGVVLGTAIGFLLARAEPVTGSPERRGTILTMGLVGLYLGPDAAVVAAVLAALMTIPLMLAARIARHHTIPLTAAVFGAAVITLAAAPPLLGRFVRGDLTNDWRFWLAGWGIVAGFALVNRLLWTRLLRPSVAVATSEPDSVDPQAT